MNFSDFKPLQSWLLFALTANSIFLVVAFGTIHSQQLAFSLIFTFSELMTFSWLLPKLLFLPRITKELGKALAYVICGLLNFLFMYWVESASSLASMPLAVLYLFFKIVAGSGLIFVSCKRDMFVFKTLYKIGRNVKFGKFDHVIVTVQFLALTLCVFIEPLFVETLIALVLIVYPIVLLTYFNAVWVVKLKNNGFLSGSSGLFFCLICFISPGLVFTLAGIESHLKWEPALLLTDLVVFLLTYKKLVNSK